MNKFEEEIIIKFLQAFGPGETEVTLSQKELSKQIGVSVGKINYCLKELAKSGCIKIRKFKNEKRKNAYAYYLTPGGVEEKFRLMVHFLSRKLKEYDKLQQEIAEIRRQITRNTAPASNPDPVRIPPQKGLNRVTGDTPGPDPEARMQASHPRSPNHFLEP